jgi:hypothetical protein
MHLAFFCWCLPPSLMDLPGGERSAQVSHHLSVERRVVLHLVHDYEGRREDLGGCIMTVKHQTAMASLIICVSM